MNLSHRFTHALLAATLTALNGSAISGEALPEWSYDKGATSPDHWGELTPAFEACSQGSYQSPIDIRNPVKADLPALKFNYNKLEPAFTNNGHTVQVNVPAGQILSIGSDRYVLQQFHFHTPSEEAFNGKRAAMVAHFVHKNATGQLLVVAVLLQAGKSNAAYGPIFSHLPRPGENISVKGLQLELPSLLPTSLTYYTYSGSLTTPPCSEGVRWVVMQQPVTIGQEQIKAFRSLFQANARPVQALNGREVRVSN